ncbi:SRF-type transcription factor (DNA-binding and dimerization domain)-domain-containing protein [Lactifluus subvellereus]|nr:SRF-type transcription factor (DNA-binding and dimerization domain)-domain-containing protein [Lactifluus subvellereus]
MAFRRPSASTVSPVNPYASYPSNPQNQQSQPSTVPPMQDETTKRADPAAHPPPTDQFINDQDANDSAGDDDEDDEKPKSDKKTGRRKIKIEFIQDKSRRHITFSKRKAGIMKKAYELSTLTGTQVLLLVVSETGLVYTFTTAKLQPLVTQPEGKNLIQACLNAPHGTLPNTMPVGPPMGRSAPMSVPPHHNNVPGGLAIGGDKVDEGAEQDEENERTGGGNPSASPHSPAQGLPPTIAIPPHAQGPHSAHPGAPNPQMSLGPSPTSASPVQQPTSPHYTHASPTQQYHPSAHGPAGHDLYAAQPGLMAPPSYGFGQPGQPTAPGQWSHGGGAVQGGYPRR